MRHTAKLTPRFAGLPWMKERCSKNTFSQSPTAIPKVERSRWWRKIQKPHMSSFRNVVNIGKSMNWRCQGSPCVPRSGILKAVWIWKDLTNSSRNALQGFKSESLMPMCSASAIKQSRPMLLKIFSMSVLNLENSWKFNALLKAYFYDALQL